MQKTVVSTLNRFDKFTVRIVTAPIEITIFSVSEN